MSNRLIKLAATAIAAGLALTGCATAPAPAPGQTGSSPAGTPAAPAGATIPKPSVSCDIPEGNLDASAIDTSKLEGEITFMTQGLKGTFDDFFTKLIADFEAENAGTKINWVDQGGSADFDTQMVTQASNCSMADVVNVPSSTILALSKGNLLLDLDTKAPGSGDIFVPTIWDTVKLGHEGTHTAYPWYFGPFVTTYNKAIFEKAGCGSTPAGCAHRPSPSTWTPSSPAPASCSPASSSWSTAPSAERTRTTAHPSNSSPTRCSTSPGSPACR